MFVLSALHSNIGILRLCRVELGLGLCHIGFWRRTSLKAILGEPQSFRVGLHRIVQKLFLRVRASELEVIERQFSLETEFRCLQVGGACLRVLTRRRDCTTHPSPKIQFVGNVEGEAEIAFGAGGSRWQIGAIGRIADRSN